MTVVTQDSGLGDDIARAFNEFEMTARRSRGRWTFQITKTKDRWKLYHDSCQVGSYPRVDDVVPHLVAIMNRTALEDAARFAIHSGAIAMGLRTVAIPAESGHGKTTLTAALVKAGFDYLSDEALVFDDDGSVVPYPKPFALSEWSARKLGVPIRGEETLATASDLGGKVGEGGRLTDLILSEYGHEYLTLEPLPKSQAVAALIQYSFNHYKDPARAFRIATDVARDLSVWRLEYDDPIEAAEVISNTLR